MMTRRDWKTQCFVTALFIILWANLAGGVGDTIVGLLLVIPVLFAGIYVSTLFHELGHAAAAVAVGRCVHAIVVGRLAYIIRLRRFTRAPELPKADFNGWVLATPAGKGDLLFALGGPLADIATGALFILFAFRFQYSDAGIFAVLLSFGEISLGLALLNLVPSVKDGETRSDGAMILDHLCGRSSNERSKSWTRFFAWEIEGFPTEESDVRMLSEIIVPSSNNPDLRKLQLTIALTVGDVEAALRLIDLLLADGVELDTSYIAARAFAIALVRGEQTTARETLNSIPESDRRMHVYWRAKAVIEHQSGAADEAMRALAEWKLLGIGDDDDKALFSSIEEGRPIAIPPPRLRLVFEKDRVVAFERPDEI